MSGRGGYRKPSNPSPVSGPGALSRRTDGGPTQAAKYIPGGNYGDGKALLDLQRQAPMAAASTPVASPPMQPLMTIYDATQFPEEPVTHGADLGPGEGSEILNIPRQTSVYDTVRNLLPYDTSGDAEYLLSQISQKGM